MVSIKNILLCTRTLLNNDKTTMVSIKGCKYSLDTKITYLKPNPKTVGSMAFKRYELYQEATTLEEYFEICKKNSHNKYFSKKYNNPDLVWDKEHGYLSILTHTKTVDVSSSMSNDSNNVK